MNNAAQKNSDEGAPTAATRGELRARLYRWTIYVLIVITLAVLVWKIVTESALQQRHETQLTEMQEEHDAQLDARSRDLLRAMGQMIEPAVFEALRTQNFDALRARLARLRRETPVERVYVTDPIGQVLFATGDGVEGVPIERELQTLMTNLNKPVIDEVGNGRLRLIAPLFAQSQKRGSIIIILQFAE